MLPEWRPPATTRPSSGAAARMACQVVGGARGVQREPETFGGVDQHVGHQAGIGGAASGQFFGPVVGGFHGLASSLEHDAGGTAAFAVGRESVRIRPGSAAGGVDLDAVAMRASDLGGAGQGVCQVRAPGRAVVDQVQAAGIAGEDGRDSIGRRAAIRGVA